MSDKKECRKYFGKKFYKQSTGYWANMMPIQAHRWVWINHHGAIPQGMDIHHIDGDKDNNEIDNLQMLSRSDHLKEHWKDPELRKERRKQLDSIRPMVHAYLRTEEGREKQRKGAILSSKTRKLFKIECHNCGKEFQNKQPWAKFCHQNCYMRHKRKFGMENVVKNCLLCNKEFNCGKYEPHEFCSISCGAKNSSKNKQRSSGKFT